MPALPIAVNTRRLNMMFSGFLGALGVLAVKGFASFRLVQDFESWA
jgi:hypothetical protein